MQCQYHAGIPLSQSLYMWGTNKDGTIPGVPEGNQIIDVPTKINWRQTFGVEEEEISISQVCCGPTDTAFVLSDGRCFVAGSNKQGQLGLGHRNPVPEPTALEFPFPIGHMEIGQNSSALLLDNDHNQDLYTFGFGGSTLSGMGQLGHGNAKAYLEPKLVESLIEDGCFVKQVQVGESHTTVLTTEGEVLTTGSGSYGRLGNFDSVDQLYLEPVELLTRDVEAIAGGKSFALALKDGVIHGWGRNHKGQVRLCCACARETANVLITCLSTTIFSALLFLAGAIARNRIWFVRGYVCHGGSPGSHRSRRTPWTKGCEDCCWSFTRSLHHRRRRALFLGNDAPSGARACHVPAAHEGERNLSGCVQKEK